MNQSEFLQALGWAVLHSIWQMALLWIAYQVLILFMPRLKASTRSALATGSLLAGFAWFAYTLGSIYSNYNIQPASPFPLLSANSGWYTMLEQALPFASILYLLLLTIPVLRFIRNYRYVQIIRTHSLFKADVGLRLFVQKLSAQMGIQKKVELWVSDLVHSPVTIGYLRPIILLPIAAVNNLGTEQVEAVLLHELAHIRRADYLLNLLVRLIQTLLYFNPFVKAFVRIVEAEREKSCDELVMQFPYDAHGYASALLAIEQGSGSLRQSMAVAASGAHKHQLLGRIENILGVRKANSFTGMRLAGILIALFCMAGMHYLLQSNAPKQASDTDGGYTSFANISDISDFSGYYSNSRNSNRTEIADESNMPEKSSDITINTIAVAEDKPSSKSAASAAEAEESVIPEAEIPDLASITNDALLQSMLSFVDQREQILTREQEAEIQKALEATQKVLTEVQWKALEKSIADAFSSAEKELVRQQLDKEAQKADWEKLEGRLRQAYAQIDWQQLNAGLEKSVSLIRLDSLNRVYDVAIANLTDLERELHKVDSKSIPDTDITLEAVTAKRIQLEQLVKRLKEMKERKVVEL